MGSHPVLLTTAILVAVAGFIAGWSGAIALILREGHQPTQAEVARFEKTFSRWNRPLLAATGKWSRLVFFNFTLGELKGVWRSGQWLREPHWRRVSLMVGGALAALFGFLCALLLVSPPASRPIVITWLVFMLVYVGWYFARA
jgi:hypothetical protein